MAQKFKTNQLIVSGQDVKNLFYPLTNPSGFITGFNSGLYALNSSTGNFITTAQTGAFVTAQPNTWSYLTCSATTSWSALPNSVEDKKILILTGSSALSISGLYNGWAGTLMTVQSGAGTFNLTLPSGTMVMNGTTGIITLTTGAGAKDMIGFEYNPLGLFAGIGSNFS